jgi:hypothetical protein
MTKGAPACVQQRLEPLICMTKAFALCQLEILQRLWNHHVLSSDSIHNSSATERKGVRILSST